MTVRVLIGSLAVLVCSALVADPVDEIERLLQGSPPESLTRIRDFELLRAEVRNLYNERGFAPLWFRDQGWTAQARLVLEELDEADQHGLRVKDYRLGRIAGTGVTPIPAGVTPREIALTDVLLSVSTMRYVKDLHQGRFSPQDLKLGLDIEHRDLDLSGELEAVASAGNPGGLLESHAPTRPGYWELREHLDHYRHLVETDDWKPLRDDAVLREGDTYSDLALLGRRLRLVGDLPQDSTVSGDVYRGEWVEAVRRFQLRHGLEDDGIIGKGTFAALNRPWNDRVAQISTSLEHMRWIPDEIAGTPIVVNVPAYSMRALHSSERAGAGDFGSRVIVGKAYQRFRTPIFSGQLQYLDFRPYWNIPRSIVRNEISPKIDQPGYLDDRDYEIVAAFGHHAKPLPVTPENIAKVKSGELKLRQRPGPNNALGLVKFIFPNEHSVFLHSTPAQSLFGKERRAFSHGCIRVADPVGLAEWVLSDQDGWDRAAIERAMSEGGPTRVLTKRPIPVYILYATSLVNPDTGAVHFWDDVYGLDRELAEALGQPLGVRLPDILTE
jgi:murein L,D-transpeptidase YcbB/YkuD